MKTRKQFIAAVLLVIAVSISLASVFSEAEAQGEVTPFPSREKTISVTGTATTEVKPDLLHVQFGVETQEKTAKEALEANSILMNAVVAAIKNAGILESEISTSNFNIYPVYEHYQEERTGRYTQELIGYRVSNVLSVETKKLDLAAPIIDGGVGAGANRVDSVFFALSPETHLQIKDNLLEKAVLNAKSKAQKALAPLDHKIIGVKAVSLSEFAMPYPTPMYRDGFAVAESAKLAEPTPIFTSDQDVSTTASVVFIIGSN
jgi:uncharacterized protein